MKKALFITILLCQSISYSQFAPPAGQVGTTAIHKDSSSIVNWASTVEEFNVGLMNIANSAGANADFGIPENALGHAEGTSVDIISLGDKGNITLGFEHPIKNGSGNDFAVFENSFDEFFLELAHVEVSTDGIRFVRLPSISETHPATQTSSFGNTDATDIYNLAGKYKQGYGTPFDLADIIDSTGINLDSINFVRIIDVVGSINPNFATFDSQGNIVNDPYPTAFSSGGFDLDAIGVIHENKVLGTSENSNFSYNIYPNPSKGMINIASNHDCELQVVTLNGQLIKQTRLLKNEKLQFNDLQNGLYLVYFKNEQNIFIKKVIVNQ